MMYEPGLEPETSSVWDWRDNQPDHLDMNVFLKHEY